PGAPQGARKGVCADVQAAFDARRQEDGQDGKRRALARSQPHLALPDVPVLAQRQRRGCGKVPGPLDVPAHGRSAAPGQPGGQRMNEAKKVLALEVTALVHGREEAEKARDAASSLFGGGDLSGSVPTTELTRAQLEEDGRLTTLLALVGLAKSRGAARKLVEQNAVRMGEEKVTDVEYRLSPDAIPADGLLLRVGKKSYHRLVLK